MTKVLIIGLGSVGNYLLDYLFDLDVEIHIATRSLEKAYQDINVIRLSNMIREKSKNIFLHQIDLENIQNITDVLKHISPEIIVNTSRAYSGIKYGSISWNTVRAYGLWSPLSVKYIKNIMIAKKGMKSIVINSSYPDVVNPWLKGRGLSPDYGSGNLNHLVPRIKFAVKELKGVVPEVVLATGHFHDVVISKEGHTEGVDPLIHLSANAPLKEVYKRCALPMPIDQKRNMMNASSNYQIIKNILSPSEIIHSPGVMGLPGGYPLLNNKIIEDYFSLNEMVEHNKASLNLDGIEDISKGVLTFTNHLLTKVKKSFNYSLPKEVDLDDSNRVADELVKKVIKR